MAKTRYVLSYVNPDTDGVSSSIGYAYWKLATTGKVYKPVIFGTAANETLFVLDHFKVTLPAIGFEIESDACIVIVDTHNKNQLPANLPFKNVEEVIDHHPEGDADIFCNATLQIERVGAVATLITERIESAQLNPPREIRGILAAAIVSNTLNFVAPSTSPRDREALDWLKKHVDISQSFIQQMFGARSDLYGKTTKEVLDSDYKEFIFGNKKVGICQLETTGLSDFLTRPDLSSSLTRLKAAKRLDHIIFNGVDIPQQKSIIVAVDSETQKILEGLFQSKFEGMTAEIPRILLRKTDFVPKLTAFFQKDNQTA
jgi:manganese-dependent inorganic pyrophosphatase